MGGDPPEGAAHNHRSWRKARSWSSGWKRAGVGLGSSRCCSTASLAARTASRYLWVTPGLECPSHKPIVARSVPDWSRCNGGGVAQCVRCDVPAS